MMKIYHLHIEKPSLLLLMCLISIGFIVGDTDPSSAGKAQIVGEVIDGFGQAIPGVTVSIENLAFSTRTDEQGRYAVGYVPGKVKVIYEKEGYRSGELVLELTTETSVPVNPVKIWETPPSPGLWYVGKSKYLPLAKGTFIEEVQLLQYVARAHGSPTVLGPTDVFVFLDNDRRTYALYKLFSEVEDKNRVIDTGDGTIAWVRILPSLLFQYRYSITNIEIDDRNIAPGMWLRKATLEPGSYAFVTVKGELPRIQEIPHLGNPLYRFDVRVPREYGVSEGRSQPLSDLQRIILNSTLGPFRHGTLVTKTAEGNLIKAASPGEATHTHPGVDLVAACGSQIHAAADGVVVDTIDNEQDQDFLYLGYMVLLKHDQPIDGRETYSLYLHMQGPPAAVEGDRVQGGETVLGKVGKTGVTSGVCHTHFEIRHFGTRYLENPEWNEPFNIYGRGNQSDTSLFVTNWEDPETIVKLGNVTRLRNLPPQIGELVKKLKEGQADRARVEAAKQLGQMGHKASPAAPALSNQGQAWQRTLQEGRASLDEGNVEEAESLFLTALDRAERFGRDDPRVAIVLNDLAQLYYDQGTFVEAEPLYQRMLAIWQDTYGPNSLHVAATLNNLGVLHRMHGQYSEAEPYLTRALAIKEERLGPDDPEVAFTLRNLATLYQTQGKYAKAEPLYRRVLEIRQKVMNPTHPSVATALEEYADVLKALDQPTEASELLAQAEEIRASTRQDKQRKRGRSTFE